MSFLQQGERKKKSQNCEIRMLLSKLNRFFKTPILWKDPQLTFIYGNCFTSFNIKKAYSLHSTFRKINAVYERWNIYRTGLIFHKDNSMYIMIRKCSECCCSWLGLLNNLAIHDIIIRTCVVFLKHINSSNLPYSVCLLCNSV